MNEITVELISTKKVQIQGISWERVRPLGKGKSGESELVRSPEGAAATLKIFRDTGESYIPFERVLDSETASYQFLRERAIPVPRLLGFDRRSSCLLKEYIDGPTATEVARSGKIPEKMLLCLIELGRRMEKDGYVLDYFPSNYILRGDQLVYIDYEYQPYTDEWNLENWGIFYWLNPEGMSQFLETGNADYINYPGSYKPIKTDEMRKRRDEVLGV